LCNLDYIFNPGSVAVVGASQDIGRIGYNILESIVAGGFRGPVYPVNGKYPEIMGLKCYGSLAELPQAPDMVALAVNQYLTVEQLELAAQLGVKAAICYAGGFKEMGPEGKALEERLNAIAREAGIALVGPNTLGVINTTGPFYATFQPMKLPSSPFSVITQSGGVGLSILAMLGEEGIGVGKWCGVGNRGSLEYGDYLEYFAEDSQTEVIGIFIEGTEKGREFVEKAAAVAQRKPVVIFKGSRGKAAAAAARTHTGSMAGSYRLYKDIFAQYGLLSADSVEELVWALQALSVVRGSDQRGPRSIARVHMHRQPGDEQVNEANSLRQVGVITHTAGPSIVAVDVLEEADCDLPELQPETVAKVVKIMGSNPTVILRNPLDLAGSGLNAPVFGQCAGALASDPAVQAILAIYCHHPHWNFPTAELIEVHAESGKPMVVCYIGQSQALAEERWRFKEAGIPLYHSVQGAARGLAALRFYGQ